MQNLSLRQLIWITLGVVVAVFLVVAAASIAGRIIVARAVDELGGHVMPLQATTSELRRAYVDQDTGQRGFMLTGSPDALERYASATATVDRLVPELRASLADDSPGSARLSAALAAAAVWKTQAAEPQIAARRSGDIPPETGDAMAMDAKRLFDDTRTRLRALSDYIDNDMATHQLERIHAAQRIPNIIQVGGAVVLLVVLAGKLVLIQRLLNRPLTALVKEVKAVADGDYDEPIRRKGPKEIAEVSAAVEEMRERLRANAIWLADAHRRVEQARIAADLQGRIIQGVSDLALGLTSASARHRVDLEPFVRDSDKIIRDLGEVIFNLNESVTPSDGTSPQGTDELRTNVSPA